ncbi:helix-turn-helix domain-containing protein [Saccharopolyspora sp. TS4A08]|uniref:Helix-turn-helix domain-containing protein n=1 Tax=Saccharopolyspora ipomoeae TaxID=3042027 RepID=A0ABT6PQZ0_9PSEU|nr:helix-turn-helix domain-containing protein [Saccharopolyspora sp. TS4A08]MDI2030307.1 helix-turn-helix domain-containing protein [Saccharopolyspora sp. TS4A08]
MSVDVDEQIGEFEASASTVFAPLRIRPLRPGPFPNSLRAASAGDVAVTRIRCAPCQVRRTPRLIGSGDRELVKVTMLTAGRGEVEQDGRRCVLTPGDLVNYDTDRPYRLRFPESYDITVVAVPKSLLGGHVDTLASRSAVAVPTSQGVQRVVGGFFRTMTDALGDDTGGLSGDVGRHLTDALVSMVLTELAELRPEPGEDFADRVRAHCLTRLDDPGLTVDSVARVHGVSVRYLHKVFAGSPMTLSAWIRRQRLERIRRDLADPVLADRTAAAIAARWGVLDGTHLSRALKAEFGMTAAEIRRTAR